MSPSTTLPPEAQWLLQRARRWVRDGIGAAPTERWPLDWQRLHTVAHYHEVQPLLYREALTSPDARWPAEVRSSIQWRWAQAVARSMWHWAMLRRCVEAFGAEQIRVLPIKGLVVGHLLYGDPALRPAVDVDVLVPAGEWARAATVLERLGYRRLHGAVPDWFRLRHWKSEEFVHPGGCVELHWTFGAWRPNVIDPAFAWAHATVRRIGTLDLLTLSWEDCLLTLALHLRRHLQSLRLKHLLDIGLLLAQRGQTLDWAYLQSQAARLRLRRTLAYVLLLAQETLELSLPADAMACLERGWRARYWMRRLPHQWCWDPAQDRLQDPGRADGVKMTLMDCWSDAMASGLKRGWWWWDEWRLRRRGVRFAPAAPPPHQDAPGEGGQTRKVAAPEAQRMAAQTKAPFETGAPHPAGRPPF